jgi:pimeloyl-ACP methyl ester carboxylesterase
MISRRSKDNKAAAGRGDWVNRMGQLIFERKGSGFPLVFVHGYLAGAGIWREQLDFFEDRFDVLAPNLPGFGDSSHLTAPDTIDEFAEQVLDGLQAQGIDRFHLLGHSMGGMIVQAMAARAPQRIASLICYGTGPVGALPDRFETIDQYRQRLKADGLEKTVRRIAATWFLKGEATDGYEACVALGEKASMQAALASLSAWETWDGRPHLEAIEADTLVVWGDRDRSYGWQQPEALWRGIADSSLAVVPGCAHNVHMEKSHLFNSIIGDFLPVMS